MNFTENILQQVAYSITSNEYLWTDHEKVAIKGNCLSAEDWDGVCITVNSFLNTKGGTVIVGIVDDEDNGRYVFEGVSEEQETDLKQLSGNFTNQSGELHSVDALIVSEYLNFLDGKVWVINVLQLPEADKYVFYKDVAWQRSVTGEQKIPGLKTTIKGNTPEITATATDGIASTTTDNSENVPENSAIPNAPEATQLFQKIYSGDLIALFGADYISLEPDYKQMLSFIYERNHYDTPLYPDGQEISSKLWIIRGEVNTPKGYELYQAKVKKILAMMEKSGFIVRYKGKPEYKINNHYEVVKNLFN